MRIYAYIRTCTQIYSIQKRIYDFCTCSYANTSRYTGFIDGYKVVYLYILICTEYSPVYTPYNIGYISFSFPNEKSKAMLPYISRYTSMQTHIIPRGCPGGQLSKRVQIRMRKQAYISECTVAYLKIFVYLKSLRKLTTWTTPHGSYNITLFACIG
jgi:hypothetical protein